MATRVAWSITGLGVTYNMQINPDDDSGIQPGDLIAVETNPIGASTGNRQVGGFKIPQRTFTGIARGTWVTAFRNSLLSWYAADATLTIVDELGESQTYKFAPGASLHFKKVTDITSFRAGRATFRWTVNLMET